MLKIIWTVKTPFSRSFNCIIRKNAGRYVNCLKAKTGLIILTQNSVSLIHWQTLLNDIMSSNLLLTQDGYDAGSLRGKWDKMGHYNPLNYLKVGYKILEQNISFRLINHTHNTRYNAENAAVSENLTD